MAFLQVKNMSKVYSGEVPYEALKKINLSIDQGEFVSIMGPSGSGKTTLLQTIATIDRPTSGQVFLDHYEPHIYDATQLSYFRLRRIGFVFQQFNLLATLSVKENIMLPLTLDNIAVEEMIERTDDVIEKLGLKQIANHRIHQISGGEAQRTAIARALIHQPSLLLADEPTGNLDSKSAKSVMELFEQINQTSNVTTLMVTHDPMSASYSQRVLFIKDGELYNEIYRGESQEQFYQRILDVLSHLGGKQHDFYTARYS